MKNDGAPAFPNKGFNSDLYGGGIGMSLRDYFATHCPITFQDAREIVHEDLKNKCEAVTYKKIFEWLCQMQLAYADSMLEQRKK